MTTAYVATLGGHIAELVELASRIEGGDPARSLWITNDSAQTKDLLADRMVEMVPFIGERDLLGVAQAVPEARRLFRRFGITRVISTGSAIALAYLPTAAAMGLSTHYIESSTRVAAPSMTGRLLTRVPRVTCWWQFDDPPAGFQPTGGVYDRFLAEGPTVDDQQRPGSVPPPSIETVVVSVGTTDRCFRRLIAQLVDVLPTVAGPNAKILWQTGASDVSGLGIEASALVPEAELTAAVEMADLVITHAGAGSLAMALKAGKVPVFVPRRAAYGEQIDDHQVELAQWAGDKGLAVNVEADEIDRTHLEIAARLQVRTRPVEQLDLEGTQR